MDIDLEQLEDGGARNTKRDDKIVRSSFVSLVRAIRYRLKNDIKLTVMTLTAMVTVLGILPFAIARFANSQWSLFAVDLLVEAGIAGGVIYAWVSGNAHRPSVFLAYFIGIMGCVGVVVLGVPGEYWFYPMITGVFFLVDRRRGLVIALIAFAVVLLAGGLNKSLTETASFLVSVMVCVFLSYAIAYHSATQKAQLELLASKDALTCVFNRRAMLEELERAYRTFSRERRTFGMLMLDLDHFKRINDQYGHSVGDQVLFRFTRLMEEHIRRDDRIFRFGGEEFIILAPNVTTVGLHSMAEKLRGTIEMRLCDPDGAPVTVSIGGAILRRDESVEDWLARVDTMLYAAKNGGRNRSRIDAVL